jgi:hypothetical protein
MLLMGDQTKALAHRHVGSDGSRVEVSLHYDMTTSKTAAIAYRYLRSFTI